MVRNNALINLLLSPFAMLYGAAVGIRNSLFDYKIFSSVKFPIPIIGIGNLAAGGTGKTPFVEYLIALLKPQYRIAVLSRGYKRDTTGFIIAAEDCTAMDVGDEPCQIKQKFPDIIVAVDANRRRGIKRLMKLPDKPDIILLDDAMQHRYVAPSLSIMLTACDNPYYGDYLLPVGSLREPAREASRADIIIVTKCQHVLKPIDLRIIEKNMALMANQSLYFSRIKYDGVKAVFPEEAKYLENADLDKFIADKELLLIAGIANPQMFIDRIKSCATGNVHTCIFSDHHIFTQSNINRINEKFRRMPRNKRIIICTEKDAMRLIAFGQLPDSWTPRMYYVPISMEFLFDRGENLDTRILTHLLSTININKDGKN